MTASKATLLERLAADPAAAPNERANALRAAKRLRARAPASGVHEAPAAASPWPPPPSSSVPFHDRDRGHVEQRGGVAYWVGGVPTHGGQCAQGYAGCPECAAIDAYRRWLRGAA